MSHLSEEEKAMFIEDEKGDIIFTDGLAGMQKNLLQMMLENSDSPEVKLYLVKLYLADFNDIDQATFWFDQLQEVNYLSLCEFESQTVQIQIDDGEEQNIKLAEADVQTKEKLLLKLAETDNTLTTAFSLVRLYLKDLHSIEQANFWMDKLLEQHFSTTQLPEMKMMGDEEVAEFEAMNLDPFLEMTFGEADPEMQKNMLLEMVEKDEDPEIKLNLVQFYLYNEVDLEQAQYWLNKLLADNYLPAYLLQAQLYVMADNVDEAINTLKSLIKMAQESQNGELKKQYLAQAYTCLGSIYQQRKEIELTLTSYINAMSYHSAEATAELMIIFLPDEGEFSSNKAMLFSALYQICEEASMNDDDSIYEDALYECSDSDSSLELTPEQINQTSKLVNEWLKQNPQPLLDAVLQFCREPDFNPEESLGMIGQWR